MARGVAISIIICLMTNFCLCYDILVVFPEPTRSHGILGDGYVRLLLEANYKVTYITPYPWTDPHVNLTQIDISSNIERSAEVLKNLTEEYSEQSNFILTLSHEFAKLVVTHPAVQAFIRNSNAKFDLVIAEWKEAQLLSSFAGYFKCPLIWSVSTQLYWQPLQLMDEKPNPAYSADVYSGAVPPLGFIQRMHELTLQVRKSWLLKYRIHPLEVELYETVFGSAAMTTGFTLPPYDDIPRNYSMMLVNTHPSLSKAWRLPPSVRKIAGYHIKMPTGDLDSNIKSIMDASPQGVIYFSMGASLEGQDMSTEMQQSFLKVFAQLPQTVLWKMDIQLENVPPNVHLLDWTPQTEILNHNNTKLFIMQGGMVSMIEAVHFAVPVIAIPMHGDEYTNTETMLKRGIAIKIDYNEDLPIKVKDTIIKILGDKSYKENMDRVSSMYHSRAAPPSAELVQAVRLVLETGARHLTSPALTTPEYQKKYLDLAAIIVSIVVIGITLIALAVRWCVRKAKRATYCRCCRC